MAVAEEGKHLLGRKVVSGNAQKRTSHANSRLFVKIFNACYKIFEGSIINTVAFIWRENMLVSLSLDITCSRRG